MDTSKKFQLHVEQLEVSTFDVTVKAPSAALIGQDPNQYQLPQDPNHPTPATYCFVCD
jgi:hypothetical protein